MSAGSPRWREKYDRMKRWQSELTQDLPVDNRLVDQYYAFFECCYHLKDWLKNDATVPRSVRSKVEAYIRKSRPLCTCGDIANGSKHLEREPGKAWVDPAARLSVAPPAFQPGVFQKDAFQTEAQVIVKVSSKRHNALKVANECVREWETFLRSKGLI